MVAEMVVNTREFSALSYDFSYEVLSPVVLNEHKGSALRGALFHSLRKVGCRRQDLQECRGCPILTTCPVTSLLATVDEGSERGLDVPRPFVVAAPLDGQNIYHPGDCLRFSLTLFAQSNDLLPYLLAAAEGLEREGLGAKSEIAPGRWGRGRLKLLGVDARNPLSGQKEEVFRRGGFYQDFSDISLTHSEVRKLGETNEIMQLAFNFLTPTRLVDGGEVLTRPNFVSLIRRLVERYQSLATRYSSPYLDNNRDELLEEARQVMMLEDRTYWEQVRGYSHRQQKDLSLGGFMGEISFLGRVDRLLPLLLWGQVIHVGKNATKGGGRYILRFKPLAG